MSSHSTRKPGQQQQQGNPITELRPGQSKPLTWAELDLLRQRITEKVQKNPQKAATLLTEWINRPAQRRTAKKTG